MNRAALVASICLFLSIFFAPDKVFAESSFLYEGIEQYKQENYEEAEEALIRAREEEPQSSAAAFFLGMTYKQMEEPGKALKHLRDAVMLVPHIRQALVELIDVAAQLGELEEAKRWIEVAEREGISPAKMAFLKGQILSQEGRNLEAIKAFETAKTVDPALTQAADFQIALGYMKEKELKKAREMLKSVVLQDPESDLAGFARNYQDVVEKRIELERPYRITLTVSEQYNDNLTSNSRDPESASGNNVHTYAFAPSIRANFVPSIKVPWTFSASYAVSASLNEKLSNSRDTVSNSLSVVPGYNFGKASVNLSTSYTHSMLRGPSYERYQDSLTIGPLLRTIFGGRHMLEFFLGYNIKEYADRSDAPPASPTLDDEDKDSRGLSTYVSWIWLFTEGAFFNLKSEYIDDTTHGKWWENDGYKFSANVSVPLLEKLRLQASGQLFIQEYRNNHTVLLNDWSKRDDETYTMSAGLTWEFYRNTSFLAQHSKTILDSNIPIYEYEQDLYSVGIEYKY